MVPHVTGSNTEPFQHTHPFIIFTVFIILGSCPCPKVTAQEVGSTPDRSQAHHRDKTASLLSSQWFRNHSLTLTVSLCHYNQSNGCTVWVQVITQTATRARYTCVEIQRTLERKSCHTCRNTDFRKIGYGLLIFPEL